MNSFSWFRRFHTELSSSRVKEHYEFNTVDCSKQHRYRPITLTLTPCEPTFVKINEGIVTTKPFCQPLGRAFFRHRLHSIHAYRFVHTVSIPKTINVQNVVDYNRLGYIYLNPSTNEEIRSKMKYLTSKNVNQIDDGHSKEDTRAMVKHNSNIENKKRRKQSSEMQMMSSFDARQAFKQTARAPKQTVETKTQPKSESQQLERKQCPKPNRCSPYVISNEETGITSTLREHYIGVIQKPNPLNKIRYPCTPQVNSSAPKVKNTLYISRQYFSTSKSIYVRWNQIRSLKEYIEKWHPMKELRKYSDTRDEISSNSKSIKKRVEVMRMEVVRLGKSLRKNNNEVRANQLSKIFNSALEQKKSNASTYESGKVFDVENKIETFMNQRQSPSTNRPFIYTPEYKTSSPNCLYVYAKPKIKKSDIKIITNDLSEMKCAPTQSCKSKVDTLSVTDLTSYNEPVKRFGYEDVPMIGDHKKEVILKAKSRSDLSIAKQQHAQQVLNAFHDINRFK